MKTVKAFLDRVLIRVQEGFCSCYKGLNGRFLQASHPERREAGRGRFLR